MSKHIIININTRLKNIFKLHFAMELRLTSIDSSDKTVCVAFSSISDKIVRSL